MIKIINQKACEIAIGTKISCVYVDQKYDTLKQNRSISLQHLKRYKEESTWNSIWHKNKVCIPGSKMWLKKIENVDFIALTSSIIAILTILKAIVLHGQI